MLSRICAPRHISIASTSFLNPQNRCETTISRRNMSALPPAIAPAFQYASDCYIAQSIQFGMESLHGLGLSWPGAFISAAILLRIGTAPLHIYAEKLFANRLHAQNFLTQGIMKKVSERYRVQLGPSTDGTKLEVKSSDPKIAKATQDALQEVPAMLAEHGLQAARIQNLKMCTVPVWIFSSFALRNVINSDFHPSVAGHLWIPDMLAPDPYFILPVAVGVFGFLNLYSQRKIYPGVVKMTWKQKSYDGVLAFFTMFAVTIMAQLPACIPLYWLIVSTTGMAQAQMLRHPKIKGIFGIKKLPTDSATPIRDLFKMRNV
ncbi:Cytochrome OXidase assembly protein [Caenorhabditis elegans]|uniref:Cytochrome OXidase assembly protein n=1 Tax=Caenorhabditis elegans TaxID=6239 RepID=Q9N356_CAEEL|nr:Cytochrome OXidase assembly protein [Caenorhabditis elegans]CCD67238.1 Cytochrome OXidase assembly protein [Caenorhabditis elegans]|eukprot:NP_500037.2 Cytochrome OXidase assembly protein [Caenorhabditis elegans]